MREVKHVQQEDRSLRARWFTCEECELHTWQHKATNQIVRFQFCYDKQRDEHILEWKEHGGLRFAAIDDGESRGPLQPKASPIIVADGVPDAERILAIFEAHVAGIDGEIRDFVAARLRDGLVGTADG